MAKIWHVDIPNDAGDDWKNVETFYSKEAAVAFCKEHFGGDDEGNINLITPGNDGEDEEEA